MLRAGLICRNERQVDVRSGRGAQFLLRLLGSFPESLQRHLILAKVDAFLVLEVLNHVVRDSLVEVITAQTVVSVRRKNLDHAVADLDDGDIERAAAEVIDHDLLLFFIVKAVGKRSSGRLIDDTLDIQSGNLTGILGCLSLRIVEVGRAGDYRFRNLLTEVSFRIRLQLLQDHSRDLLRRILLGINVHSEVGSHMSLDGRDGTVRVCDSLSLCGLSDKSLPILCKCNDRRCCS